MATRCHKCRDLTGQCQDCWQADNGVIRYSDPPPPQDVVTFHGPQFGVSQTQHDAVVAERDALKAEVARGCWVMQRGVKPDGYAEVFKRGKNYYAHRVVYEAIRGPIPAGMQIDHLCRNRSCVNPDHLEVVTRKENILRGISPPAINSRKTHCPRGHRYDRTDAWGRKVCGFCKAEQTRQWRRRQRAALRPAGEKEGKP